MNERLFRIKKLMTLVPLIRLEAKIKVVAAAFVTAAVELSLTVHPIQLELA